MVTGMHDVSSGLAALREHLAELQLPQIAYGRRAIILLEGIEGAGKKNALKQIAEIGRASCRERV